MTPDFSPATGQRMRYFRQRVNPIKFVWAKGMRRRPTRGEAAFWQLVRKNAFGVRFHRQKVILGWIADFWCPKASLIVEIDGAGHDFSRDGYRTRVMNDAGFAVMRFTAAQVLDSPDFVRRSIQDFLNRRNAEAMPR